MRNSQRDEKNSSKNIMNELGEIEDDVSNEVSDESDSYESEELEEIEEIEEELEMELDEIWPNSSLSADLENLNKVKRSNFGYNNLYSRSFVNKVISIEKLLGNTNTKHLITLLLKLNNEKNEKGYVILTTIKCFLILKNKLKTHDFLGGDGRPVLDKLRDLFFQKVKLYQKFILTYDNRTRFRALKILLLKMEQELL